MLDLRRYQIAIRALEVAERIALLVTNDAAEPLIENAAKPVPLDPEADAFMSDEAETALTRALNAVIREAPPVDEDLGDL